MNGTYLHLLKSFLSLASLYNNLNVRYAFRRRVLVFLRLFVVDCLKPFRICYYWSFKLLVCDECWLGFSLSNKQYFAIFARLADILNVFLEFCLLSAPILFLSNIICIYSTKFAVVSLFTSGFGLMRKRFTVFRNFAGLYITYRLKHLATFLFVLDLFKYSLHHLDTSHHFLLILLQLVSLDGLQFLD